MEPQAEALPLSLPLALAVAHPWEEKEEEEKEETTLLVRQSKRLDNNNDNNNKPTAMAQKLPPHNGEVNGGNLHNHLVEEVEEEEEEIRDNAAADDLQKNSVYFDKNQGNECVDGNYSGFESSVLDTYSKVEELHFEANNFDIQRNLSTEINHHHNKGDEIISCLTRSPEHILSEEKSTNLEHLGNKTTVDTDVDILDEIDQEPSAIDVVRVLENQNTHDLYCPNCNSCITRRVILRKRKLKVRNVRPKVKQDKFEKHSAAAVTTDQSDDALNIGSIDSPAPAADDENHDRQLDVFGCLSCFSLFTPTGNGFKLFRIFGHSDDNPGVQNVQNISSSKKNWFYFASEKRKPTTDEGNSAPEHSEVDGINQHISSGCSENVLPYHGTDLPVAPLGDKNPVETKDPADDSHIKSQQGNGVTEYSEVNEINQHTSSCCFENMLPCHGSDHPVGPLGDSNPIKTTDPAVDSHFRYQKDGIECLNAMGKDDTGDDVEVIVETQTVEVVSSQGAHNVDIPMNTGILPQTEIIIDENRGPEVTESHQWDILKSIVYGGLTESITSLGIVTSAAAAGAATLDILAMGLANLMGGLFVVAHNLGELKNDLEGETSTGMNKKEDRYQQLLGRRENFWVHATVVVLSYLIFGLMPPVIYGFSFRKIDNRDMKIAAVAGSTLACIIFLAVGKVHTQKPPRSYMKTVLYYVSIGLLSSGMSYIVGDLIKQLLEKFNSVESILDLSTGRASY